MEICQEEWPLIFFKSSTLQVLAVIVALNLWYENTPGPHQSSFLMALSLTVNRGNEAVLNKLMTTKYPAFAVLMELSIYVMKVNLRTVVEWTHVRNFSLELHLPVSEGALKSNGCQPNRSRKDKRRRSEERLRVTEPW